MSGNQMNLKCPLSQRDNKGRNLCIEVYWTFLLHQLNTSLHLIFDIFDYNCQNYENKTQIVIEIGEISFKTLSIEVLALTFEPNLGSVVKVIIFFGWF